MIVFKKAMVVMPSLFFIAMFNCSFTLLAAMTVIKLP